MNSQTNLRFDSSVALSADARSRLIDALDPLLASTLDAHLMTKQAHWNLRGPFFFARHELFDRVAEHLEAQADELAERVGTLGGIAHGTVRMAAKNTQLASYDEELVDGEGHIRALVSRLSTLTAKVREGIALAGELEDAATEDLLTETLRLIELDMWFLESHLQTS